MEMNYAELSSIAIQATLCFYLFDKSQAKERTSNSMIYFIQLKVFSENSTTKKTFSAESKYYIVASGKILFYIAQYSVKKIAYKIFHE